MKELQTLRDRVIHQGFPELLSEDIQVEYQELKDALFQYGSLTEEGYYIEVDASLKEAPEAVLIGGFAHELSHIIADKSLTKRIMFRDRIAYQFSKRYKVLDERNTDLEVILRGFAKELLAFLEYSEKSGYPHYKEDGLSIREVKALISIQGEEK
jgi:hypothetical protein